ncbi:hypothetical protein KCP70_00930 [Salmonella enterica subsp. enterica]|nr:hypothetical protein KCP70_00930 [Salmonella enterica subsp. enterica]
MMTSFTRIIIVLACCVRAGTPSAPPNQVLLGLALLLTFLLCRPSLTRYLRDATCQRAENFRRRKRWIKARVTVTRVHAAFQTKAKRSSWRCFARSAISGPLPGPESSTDAYPPTRLCHSAN